MTRLEVERQAKILARENQQAEPDICKIYWFPDEDEVRLVEVHPQVPQSGDGQVHPYFFRPSPADDLPAPSGIALINPAEFGQAQLPPQWGSWDDAIELELQE